MTTSPISSISSSMASSSDSTLKLLMAKLKAMGVDTSNITTVTQAETALIEAKTSPSQAEKHPPSNNPIKAAVDILAAEVGVSVSAGDKPAEIMEKIAEAINKLKSDAADNEPKLQEAAQYQASYDSIQQQIATMHAQMAASMQGMANYNKASLGLS